MKLCRYDDDRLGVVIGDRVHDVTAAQTEIRASTPYTAKVDPVVAALPAWRERLEKMAASAPSKPIAQVKLLSPVAKPPKILAAPTNYSKHIEEMQKFRDTVPGLARFSPDIEKAGIFLKSNTSLVVPMHGGGCRRNHTGRKTQSKGRNQLKRAETPYYLAFWVRRSENLRL